MPYFVYCIKTPAQAEEDKKSFTLLKCFDQFLQARDFTRAQRSELAKTSTVSDTDATQTIKIAIKIVFAGDQDEALQLLNTKRTPPILREWEK